MACQGACAWQLIAPAAGLNGAGVSEASRDSMFRVTLAVIKDSLADPTPVSLRCAERVMAEPARPADLIFEAELRRSGRPSVGSRHGLRKYDWRKRRKSRKPGLIL